MCGIAGIVTKNTIDLQKEIISMSDLVMHRGPDGSGYYLGNNFAFGHRRLSILDLTQKGEQPMSYLNKYVITYNGEIYNYIELRKELMSDGYCFKSDTDTEVILAAFDCWGKDALNRFNGMFSFSIYIKAENKLFCARDRFGVKPFYYIQLGGKFAFASEIKQFSCLKEWKAILNKKSLYDFLINSGIHDHTNETFFENVYQLRGGEYLEYYLEDYSFKISKWYELKISNSGTKPDFEQAKSRFRDLFVDTIKLRLRSDVKVGSCLSGGLDSSSIVFTMNDLLKQSGSNQKQETISACFSEKKVDEQEFIDEVILKTKVKAHKVFPTFKNVFGELDKIIWHQDEPFGSSSILAQWSVYKESRKRGTIVMLDGQGADEYLCGYPSFQQIYFRELFLKGRVFEFIRSLNNYKQKYRSTYHNPFMGIIKMLANLILPIKLITFLSKSTKDTNKNSLNNCLKVNEFNYGPLQVQNKSWISKINRHSENQLLIHSLPRLLHHQDRDSMAHSVESRVPFLDYRLVEFVIGLPSDFKINKAVTKYILREAIRGFLPEKIVNRYDKLGFATPEETWFKENKSLIKFEIENACDCLNKYINKTQVMNIFENTILQENIDTSFFWRLICVGRWIKVFDVIL